MDHWSRGSIARVRHHFDAPRELKLRRNRVQVRVGNVSHFMRPGPGLEIARFNQLAHFLNRFAMQSAGAAHGLKTVELGRIVAARDHHRAVGLQMNG